MSTKGTVWWYSILRSVQSSERVLHQKLGARNWTTTSHMALRRSGGVHILDPVIE